MSGAIHCLPPQIQHLHALVELDQRTLGGLWTTSGYQRELDSPNSHLLMLEHHPTNAPTGIIGLGCFWAILDEAHLTLLAIDPPYQRRGLGQWLLLHLLGAARQRHLQRATLEVRPSNSRALALYKRYGFVELGHRRAYYKDGEDALILWQNHLQTDQWGHDLVRWHTAATQRLTRQGWTLHAPPFAPLTSPMLGED